VDMIVNAASLKLESVSVEEDIVGSWNRRSIVVL
jgi:hypothetical protein